jgi:hypothetical protein
MLACSSWYCDSVVSLEPVVGRRCLSRMEGRIASMFWRWHPKQARNAVFVQWPHVLVVCRCVELHQAGHVWSESCVLKSVVLQLLASLNWRRVGAACGLK